MDSKEDVRYLINGLCDGDLNSEARKWWTVGTLVMLSEWAGECNDAP